GDAIAFDPYALAFEDDLDALGDAIASKKEDGPLLYTMSGELCTYSSEVLISPYQLIKDEVLPNESELLFECELLLEPELLSEMIIMFSAI
ncbi:hypothetical protein Tco_0249540, partial [Tanacetum coccineum]